MTVAVLSLLLIGLTLLLLGAIVWGLRQMVQQQVIEPTFFWWITFGLVGWLALVGLVAQSGFLLQFESLPPRMPFFVLAPAVILVFLLRHSAVQAWLQAVPLSYLLGIQSFRIVGELLLWGMAAQAALPERMTFEGWNFDIVMGLTAPLVAWGAARGRLGQPLLVAWNLAGLVFLLVVASMGFLTMPSPLRVFVEDDVRYLADFPWIWLPTFLVALGYYAHVFALWKLWRKPSL